MAVRVFPQLLSGAIAQFPLERTYEVRRKLNGSQALRENPFVDVRTQKMEWTLHFEELCQAEADKLRDFFHACQGRLRSFLFLDPCGNLLNKSENMLASEWNQNGLIQMTPEEVDGQGCRSTTLLNLAGIEQEVSQDLPVPASYRYCLSAQVSRTSAGSIKLFARTPAEFAEQWFAVKPGAQTVSLPINLASHYNSLAVGIGVSGSDVVKISRFQLEPQLVASAYKPTISHGHFYPNAHLITDHLALIATGSNQYSTEIAIESQITWTTS